MLTNSSHTHSQSLAPTTTLVKTEATTKETLSRPWLQNGLQPNLFAHPKADDAHTGIKAGTVYDFGAVDSSHRIMNTHVPTNAFPLSAATMLPPALSCALGTTPLSFGDILTHRSPKTQGLHAVECLNPAKRQTRNPRSLVCDVQIVDAVQQRLTQVQQNPLLADTFRSPSTVTTASPPLHSCNPTSRASANFSLHSLVHSSFNYPSTTNTFVDGATWRDIPCTTQFPPTRSVVSCMSRSTNPDISTISNSSKGLEPTYDYHAPLLASSFADTLHIPPSTVVCRPLNPSPPRSVAQVPDPLPVSTSATLNVPVTAPVVCSSSGYLPTSSLPQPRVSCSSRHLSPPRPTQQSVSGEQTIKPSKDPLPCINMRHANVLRYPKYTNRKNSGFDRRLKHTGLIVDPHSTLRLLRKFLQPFINQAVDKVLQHYMKDYIMIAVRNIRQNLGDDAVTEADLMKFRRSVMQRVALQYFPKEEPHSSSVESSAMGNSQEQSHPNPESKRMQSQPNTTSPMLKRIHRQMSGSLAFHPLLNTDDFRDEVGASAAELDEGTSCTVSPHLSPLSEQQSSVNRPSSNISDVSLFSNRSLLGHSHPVVHSSRADCDKLNPKLPSVILNPLKFHDLYSNTSLDASPVNSPSSTSSNSTVGFFHNLSSPEDRPFTPKTAPLTTMAERSKMDSYCKNSRQNMASRVYSFDACAADEHLQGASTGERKKVDQDSRLKRGSSLKDRLKRARKRSLTWYNLGGYARRPKVRRTVDIIHNQSSWRRGDSASRRTSDQVTVNTTRPSLACRSRQQWNTSLTSSSATTQASLPLVFDQNTTFTLGSNANTWLGLGAARGRIYTKHPELFRYPCDAEDKSWLVNSGLLTSQGVKAFLMHSDQVRQIGQYYKQAHEANNGTDEVDQLKTFTVPLWLFQKIHNIALQYPQFIQTAGPTVNLPNKLTSPELKPRQPHPLSSNSRAPERPSAVRSCLYQSPEALVGRRGVVFVAKSSNSPNYAVAYPLSQSNRASTTPDESQNKSFSSMTDVSGDPAIIRYPVNTPCTSSYSIPNSPTPVSSVPTSIKTASGSPTPPTLQRFDST
ncbi:hypothetical protein CRM22_008070 [Opisthorchis felineus]|uniref:Uncharacterized protein n=2 Tax=Opisthorchis felineus TaxID=147828 RepID=A0A4S2LJV9_OPIFE|nr:hypothetical protein CRM22_008070 [Opisthorchis felineus]TGZ61269.1 hypothetical protein CRM22_008070 [Opisthorchis felineus]